MSNKYYRPDLAVLKHILSVKVGPKYEPLAVHSKSCMGCHDCLPYVRILKQREKELENKEVVEGISYMKALELRQVHTIAYYYPRGDEFRKPNGHLDPNVYLVLKLVQGSSKDEGFIDQDIWDYFHINQGESQRFKAKYFPNWMKDKDEILNTRGLEALKEFEAKHVTHKTTSIVKM